MAHPLYDARLRGFPVAVRLTALYTAATGAAAVVGETRWGILIALIGAVALVRLPRRTRLVECAFALALLPAVAPDLLWVCIAGAVACVGLVFIAPEDRRQPLNGLDRLFISTDYAGLMDYHLWFDTAEPVDELALRSAARDLLGEVPLARSFVRSSPLGSERFSAPLGTFDDRDVVRMHDADMDQAAGGIFNSTMPIDCRPPWTIDVFRSGATNRLMFSFHHSFVDGTGAMYMMDLFAERYDLAQGLPPTSRLPLPPPPERVRDRFADKSLRWKLALVRNTLGKRMQTGTRYASVHDRTGDGMGRAQRVELHADETSYARYRRRARELGCSTNTLIVACALAAAMRWRTEHDLAAEPARILVATDIRDQLGLPRCLQNWVSQIAVVVPATTTDVAELVRALDEGVERAKSGEALDQTLRLAVNAAVYPTSVGRAMFAKREADAATHTLTLGATTLRWNPAGPLATSSLGVAHLDLLGPVSRVPGLTLFAAGTRTDLRINLGYRDGVLSDDGAHRFAELVRAELERACRGDKHEVDAR